MITVCNAVYLDPVMHRSDAYSSTSCSQGIRWLPSPEVCRMRSYSIHYKKPGFHEGSCYQLGFSLSHTTGANTGVEVLRLELFY